MNKDEALQELWDYSLHPSMKKNLSTACVAFLIGEYECESETLIISELYKMKNKPVWLKIGNRKPKAYLLKQIAHREEIMDDYDFFSFKGTHKDEYLSTENYGKTWWAYNNEPREVKREY